MRLGPFTLLTPNYWVDLRVTAEYTAAPVGMPMDAVTSRQGQASATNPERLGDWMVPLADLDQWIGRRARARVAG